MPSFHLVVYARKTREGVQIYRDKGHASHFCTFTHANHTKVPDRRNKWITLNCFRYRLQWI